MLISRRFASTSASLPCVISSFSSLKPVVSRVVLRVHPDVLVGAGLCADGARLNESSLSNLFRLLDGIKGHCDEKKPASHAKLAGAYDMTFWHASPRAPPGSGLVLTRHGVSFTAARESELSALAASGRINDARAHWIALGVAALRPVAEAAGVVPRGSLVLSQSLQGIVDRDARKAATDTRAAASSAADKIAWSPTSVEAALRSHLLNNPPLWQGKHGGSVEAAGASRNSVYSTRQCRARVESLVSRPGWLIIDQSASTFAAARSSLASMSSIRLPGSAIIAARFRKFFADFHDELHLYHPLWDRASVIIKGPADSWGFDAVERRLCVSVDCDDMKLVNFFRAAWPEFLKKALQDVSRSRDSRPPI